MICNHKPAIQIYKWNTKAIQIKCFFSPEVHVYAFPQEQGDRSSAHPHPSTPRTRPLHPLLVVTCYYCWKPTTTLLIRGRRPWWLGGLPSCFRFTRDLFCLRSTADLIRLEEPGAGAGLRISSGGDASNRTRTRHEQE